MSRIMLDTTVDEVDRKKLLEFGADRHDIYDKVDLHKLMQQGLVH